MDNMKKAESLFAAALGIVQCGVLFGVASDTLLQAMTGKEALIVAGISAGIGVVQTFVLPIFRKNVQKS